MLWTLLFQKVDYENQLFRRGQVAMLLVKLLHIETHWAKLISQVLENCVTVFLELRISVTNFMIAFCLSDP